jgi:hypothetical protein
MMNDIFSLILFKCPEPTALHAPWRSASEWTKVHPYKIIRAYGSATVQARNTDPKAIGALLFAHHQPQPINYKRADGVLLLSPESKHINQL